MLASGAGVEFLLFLFCVICLMCVVVLRRSLVGASPGVGTLILTAFITALSGLALLGQLKFLIKGNLPSLADLMFSVPLLVFFILGCIGIVRMSKL